MCENHQRTQEFTVYQIFKRIQNTEFRVQKLKDEFVFRFHWQQCVLNCT